MPGVTDTLVTVGGGQQQVVNSGSIYVKLSPIEDTRLSRRKQLMAKTPRSAGDKAKFPDELGYEQRSRRSRRSQAVVSETRTFSS